MPYNKSEYDKEYAKQHITRKFIPFNDTVPEDVELLEWLSMVGNVTQYIKRLIRSDLEENKSLNARENHNHDVLKTLKGLKIPLIDGYENKEAIDLAVKESHNIYIGWYEDYEYRVDTDTKTILTVIRR